MPVTMARLNSRANAARRPHATLWLWSLALVMGGTGAALHLSVVASWAPVTVPTFLPWWVLAILFGVAETTVIHVQIRHDSHTLSLTEFPIVLGLALAAPVGLIAGRLVGSAIALVLGRRQPPVKLAFNLGLFYLETTTALVVYRSILGSGAPLDPMGWLAALAAIVAIVVLGLAAIITAISIHDPSKSLRALIKVTPVSTVVSLEAALFGLLAAFALAVSLWAALILIPAVVLFIAILRSYGVLIKRHDELQAVYGYVQEGESGPQDDNLAIEVITSGIMVAAKASACALVIVSADHITVHRGSGAPEVSDRAGLDDFAAEVARLADLRASVPGPAASLAFDRLGLACAYVLKVELEEAVGAIVVGPKVGQESEYGPSGRALIETLAASAAARLRRFELVRRLRAEIEARQEIIRSKDQLVASVSHALRTPMTSVLGFADLLRSNSPVLAEDERVEMLQAIVEQSLDITNILEDLLTVARSDTGSLTVQLQAVDLLAEARAVVSSLERRDSRPIDLVGDPIPAIADPNRVRQVLRNLVVNARRYGGDSIRVEVGRDGGAAYVRVVDDGPGVSPALCDQMFEPYVRTRGSLSQPASVGLGLTISRRLARLMGGEITYRRSGGETTFELTVPLAAPGRVAA
jgi:signal transduction histidine kinase